MTAPIDPITKYDNHPQHQRRVRRVIQNMIRFDRYTRRHFREVGRLLVKGVPTAAFAGFLSIDQLTQAYEYTKAKDARRRGVARA